jgi:hypothetical protein
LPPPLSKRKTIIHPVTRGGNKNVVLIRTPVFTIFSIKILLNAAYSGGKIHREVGKVKENKALYRNFFDLFGLAVKI